ncbi:MAG: asparaginase [Actinomycetota bacterium]|nr:asparaginase [Actinomycetota bacterium]
MEPILVEVRRGGTVEAVHRVHAVAVRDGEIVEAAGDPELRTFLRSSAKPFQALPLIAARDDLDDRDLAIASASHLADPEQLAAVRALLAKAPATEDDLECGPDPTSLEHNCSGKHAGMLALCAARGWPKQGYRLPDHPVQQACLDVVAGAAEVDRDSIPTGTDGCGVVAFALTLERMAHMFARLSQLDHGARVAAAMRAYPELIRGPGAPDTELMRTHSGWTAKGGAEGLLCAAGPDGLGLALKVEDGGHRAVGPALAAFADRLGVPLRQLAVAPVENSRGEPVGDVQVVSAKTSQNPPKTMADL